MPTTFESSTAHAPPEHACPPDRASVPAGKTQWEVLACWALVGVSSGPLVGPLPIEHGAEMSFPIPANASTTVLALVGAIVSFLQVALARRWLAPPPRIASAGQGRAGHGMLRRVELFGQQRTLEALV